jgi:hypothetical protein
MVESDESGDDRLAGRRTRSSHTDAPASGPAAAAPRPGDERAEDDDDDDDQIDAVTRLMGFLRSTE